MTRSFTRLFCIVLLLLSLALPAYGAETQQHTVKELGITVTFPADHLILTRSTDKQDPTLAAAGINPEAFLMVMPAKEIYLFGVDAHKQSGVSIKAYDTNSKPFNLRSAEELGQLQQDAAFDAAQEGMHVIKQAVYPHTQTNFIKLTLSTENSESSKQLLNYYTIYNGKGFHIILESLTPISATKEKELDTIVDSIFFDPSFQNLPSDTSTSATAAFRYTHPETKLSFTVPKNWKEQPAKEPSDLLQPIFESMEEPLNAFLYSYVDLWEMISDEERAYFEKEGLDRSSLDARYVDENSSWIKQDFLKRGYAPVTYHEQSYLKALIEEEAEGLTVIEMVCVENGYLHFFRFVGKKDSKSYADFETVLERVERSTQPPTASIASIASTASTASTASIDSIDSTASPSTASPVLPAPFGASLSSTAVLGYEDPFFYIGVLLFLLILLLIYLAPALIFRYFIRKRPLLKRSALCGTLIFSGCGLVCFCALTSAAFPQGRFALNEFLLLSALFLIPNYFILIRKKKEQSNPTAVAQQSSSSTVQTPSAPLESVQHFCTQCGNALQPNTLFCGQCGLSLTPEQASDTRQQEEESPL